MTRAQSMAEYTRLVELRNRIISENRARRMRRAAQPALTVPPKPLRPLVPIAYEADGTYHGRLACEADCPAGCVVRWEEAIA